MAFFVARRLFYLLPVLIAVSLLTFSIASLLPGDLAYTILGDQATPENVAALRADMGLDQPIWWRYLSWLGNVLQGDFGRSFRTGQTVLQAVAERLPVSIELMLLAELGALSIGVPLAIVCAARSGSAFDRFMTGTAFGMLSVPTFLSAILLIYLFAVELRWLPATGYVPFARRPARQSALHGAAGADAGAGGMAGHHARAAFRHDRDPAGRLYRARQGQRPEAVAHPVRACAETVVADAGDDHRHQYRPADRRRRDRRDDLRACRASAGCWSARSTRATSSSCRAWCCWSPPASSS